MKELAAQIRFVGIVLELARNFELPLARATKEQYDRMIEEGLGELDKSGIAELTFKDRRKQSPQE